MRPAIQEPSDVAKAAQMLGETGMAVLPEFAGALPARGRTKPRGSIPTLEKHEEGRLVPFSRRVGTRARLKRNEGTSTLGAQRLEFLLDQLLRPA